MFFKVIAVILAAVALTSGVTIQCTFVEQEWIIIGIHYSCYPATIISDGNLTHVIGVTGNHLNQKTNADVKVFHIKSSHKHLDRIPKRIGKFFPNLRGIVWYDGILTTLTADDLKPFPELQMLYAAQNKLISLDDDLFQHSPKIEFIAFYNNLLKHVGFGIFDNLSKLTEAQFVSNPCINMNAKTPADFQQLKLKLQNQCPPMATTTTTTTTPRTSTSLAPATTISSSTESGKCSIECVGLIETLKEKIEIQNEKIAVQADEMVKQKDENTAMKDAIQELEKQIRELWARP